VYEVHPEVSFAALNGGVGLVGRKQSVEGQAMRMTLLARDFGFERIQALVTSCPRRMAATDDVLDALVALWTARRIALGVALTLPSTPQFNSAGLRMAIHY
jgi:predicted RNase H-like nuclease